MRIWIVLACFATLLPLEANRTRAQPSSSPSIEPLPRSVPNGHVDLYSGDLIQFAAGAIELRPPPGWKACEVPRGREVWLFMTPEELTNSRSLPDDSVWFAYHVVSPPGEDAADELSALLPRRLDTVYARSVTLGEIRSLQVGPWPAVVSEFLVSVSQSEPMAESIGGKHLLVRTDWGIVEMHAAAPANRLQQRGPAWDQIWETLRLIPPSTPNARALPELAAAEPILGSWKAYRSRLRLAADGTVAIVPDSVDLLAEPDERKMLRGRFQAAGDLLYVVWDDGSRLNLRWRTSDNNLFLTDHEGQISQLKRLLE